MRKILFLLVLGLFLFMNSTLVLSYSFPQNSSIIPDTGSGGASGSGGVSAACDYDPWKYKTTKLAVTYKPIVNLFVMSFCPYWIQAEESLWEVKSTLGDEVIFDPHFLVGRTDGEYTSLHGEYELIEDVRQLCILYEYSEDHWWTYINCLYDRYGSDSWNDDSESPWRDCADNASIDVITIENCIETMNSTLLCYDYRLAQEFNVRGSPTVLINGNEYSGPRTPEAYSQAISETSLKWRVSALESLVNGIVEQLIIVKQAICSVHPFEGFEFCEIDCIGAALNVIDYNCDSIIVDNQGSIELSGFKIEVNFMDGTKSSIFDNSVLQPWELKLFPLPDTSGKTIEDVKVSSLECPNVYVILTKIIDCGEEETCPCGFLEEDHEVCCPSDCQTGYYCRANIYRFGRFSRSEDLGQGECKRVNPSQYSIELYGVCEI